MKDRRKVTPVQKQETEAYIKNIVNRWIDVVSVYRGHLFSCMILSYVETTLSLELVSESKWDQNSMLF